MFDPVKNAKSVGVLFAIGTVFDLFSLLLAFGTGVPLVIIVTLISTILTLAVAIGLIMTKKWAIYALGVLILIDLVFSAYNFINTQQINPLELIFLAIFIFAFLWFYSARARFK